MVTAKTTEGAAIKYANAGIVSGELAGSATAVQMPDLNTELINFKAVSSNAGNVYIGVAGVTVVDGTTDTTTGFELAAGEETGFIPVTNANLLYRICDNAGDDLTYIGVL
jgi:hypothetical protein